MSLNNEQQYLQTLTSFSGADLVVTVGTKAFGELQSISWAIQREKAPIYTLGSPDPRSFSRGKRGIAGSLIFASFDRDALFEVVKGQSNIFPKAMFTAAGNRYGRQQDIFADALGMVKWNQTVENLGSQGSKGLASDGSSDTVNIPPGFSLLQSGSTSHIAYIDQLPPFDITMTYANEYGQAAFQKIYDVDILNEGSGVSVDTIVMERQMTYIARRISPIISGVYTRDTKYDTNGQYTGAPVWPEKN